MKNLKKSYRNFFLFLTIFFSVYCINIIQTEATYSKKIDLSCDTGCNPYYGNSLVLKDNKFYGLTYIGGNVDYSAGVIFEWDPETNIYENKIEFDYVNGAWPDGNNLTLKDGKFYGMTAYGGAGTTDPNYGDGVIFEWDPETNIYIKKFDFEGTNGYYPEGTMALKEGKFYGTAAGGGTNDAGVIFEWDPVTNIFTKKFDFGGENGEWPWGMMTLKDNKFYGMTYDGGTNDAGVIFEWDPVTNIFTKKFDFGGENGDGPSYSLTLKDNKFYGLTGNGGTNNAGIIFEWDPVTNIFTKKVDFDEENGKNSFSSLTFKNNKFYGLTKDGGINNFGVIFEWDPATNIFTKKVDFSGDSGDFEGKNPISSLALYNDKLYGMTYEGGIYDTGVIFEWYENQAPLATSVTISGTPYVGQTLTGSYTYSDTESDTEAMSTFRWLRDDVAIDGATNPVYTTVIDDANHTIKFEVTPVAATGTTEGEATTSDGLLIERGEPTNTGPTAEKFQQDILSGFISVDGNDPLTTTKVTFVDEYTIIAGSAEVVIPAGTEMTNTEGGTFDFTDMDFEDITATLQNTSTANIAGAVDVGIPGFDLSFSQNITITIPVAASYNNQTLNVYFQNENNTSWDDGLTCLVTDGSCQFETNHATIYSAGDNPTVKHRVSGGSTPTKSTTPKLSVANILPITNTPPVTPNQTIDLQRTLKLGLIGEDVKLLQIYLNTHNFPVSLTGPGSLGHETNYFGNLTKQAVIKFQLANKIVADGIVGPITRSYMK